MKIYCNKIQCKYCKDIIESKSVHDMRYCSCNRVGVDGGYEYLRRCGYESDYIELSVYELEDNEKL